MANTTSLSYDEYKKKKKALEEEPAAVTPAASSNGAMSYEEYKAKKEQYKDAGYNKTFDLFGKTYVTDSVTGETRLHSFDRLKPSTEARDIASVNRTGHDTLNTDIGEMAVGTLKRRGANYLSTLGTLGLAGASLFRGNDYQPEEGSTLWKMLEASKANSAEASNLLAGSKEGRGFLGSTLMDVGSSAIDVAIDSALSALIPGIGEMSAGMGAMAIRSFGGTAQEKRDEGKSISTQFISGVKSAAIEYLTEKMWTIGGRKGIEGSKGWIERMTGNWETTLIEKGVPAILEKMGAAFGSEAVEEMMSDILNPIVDRGLEAVSKRLGGDYEASGFPTLSEVLYDGLVGGLVGLGGGVSEGVKLQRDINASGVSNWITAEREQQQASGDDAALTEVMNKLATKDGKKRMGPLFKASVASYFAQGRGLKVGNQMANDFFKAYESVKAEEFENPAEALGKIVEKYEDIQLKKIFGETETEEESKGSRYIDPVFSEEQQARATEALKQGMNPETNPLNTEVETPDVDVDEENVPFDMEEEEEPETQAEAPEEEANPVEEEPYKKANVDNDTAVIDEYNADIGDKNTILFNKKAYEAKETDRVIGKIENGNVVNVNHLYKGKQGNNYRIIQRGVDNYLLVDDANNVSGVFDEAEKAFAAARGTSESYVEARVKIARGAFATMKDGQFVLDLNSVYTKENYDKSMEGNDKNNRVRFITRTKSYASDIMGVKYSTYRDALTTTESLTLDLTDTSSDDIESVMKDLIDATATGGGIKGTNGKTYVFAGQTASQRKNGIIQLMSKEAFDNVRKEMQGFLSDKEIEEVNPAKYLANEGVLYTPSNADTGVKIKDCIVMKDWYELRYNVTNDFMVTDLTNDRESIIEDQMKAYKEDAKQNNQVYDEKAARTRAEEFADKVIKGGKVGMPIAVLTDVLMANSTDGFGLVWADNRHSFQMRSVGGIKGMLQSFNWVEYLEHNLPYGYKGDYFMRDSEEDGGKIYAFDRWGKKIAIEGKKAILFESTVKFADKYGQGEAGSDNFYAKIGDKDIRSIPRENVYGSNSQAGMVENMKRRGLAQFLRKEFGFTYPDIEKIANEYLYDIENAIMSDPKLMMKMFAADTDAMSTTTTSFQSVMVSLLGEQFFNTSLGKKWAATKLSQIAKEFKSGNLYMSDDQSDFGWIAPDVVGLFNRMANISYKGYAGLAEGQITNQKLQEGSTVIGRNPSAETNDVQIRKNVRNETYKSLVEEYGLDPTVTMFALADNLGLNLDNDFDGDTATLFQGVLAEMLERVRAKTSEETGRDFSKATTFSHENKSGTNKEFINSDSIIGVVQRALDAQNVGIFDNAIDILDSIPTEQLDPAVKRFNEDNAEYIKNKREGKKYTAEEFRDLLMARFAVAYKYNFDFAKQGFYPEEFKKVIDDTRKMLDDILTENGYTVKWSEDGESARTVPASWENSNNPNKRAAFERARNAQANEKGKFILDKSESLGGLMSKLDDRKHSMDVREKLGKATGAFRLSFLSTLSNRAVSKFGLTHTDLVKEAREAMLSANAEYQDTERTLSQNREAAQRVLYNFQKATGFNNEQFTSFMIYALQLSTENAGGENTPSVETLFSLNQKRFNKNSKEPTTAEIFIRNAKMMLTYQKYMEAQKKAEQIPKQLDELIKKVNEARPHVADSEEYNKLVSLRKALEQAEADMDAVGERMFKTGEILDEPASDPAVWNDTYQIYQTLENRLHYILQEGNKTLTEYNEINDKIGDIEEVIKAELETIPELQQELSDLNKALAKNKDLFENVVERAKNLRNTKIATEEFAGDEENEAQRLALEEAYNNRATAQETVEESVEAEQPKETIATSLRDAWKRATKNFGGYHGQVSDATEAIVKQKIKEFKELSKALADVNNGKTENFDTVIEEYDKLEGTRYYNKEVSDMLKNAKDLQAKYFENEQAEAQEAKANPTLRSSKPVDYKRAYIQAYTDALKYMNTFAKNTARRVDTLNQFKSEATSKAKPLGRFLSGAVRWQVTSPTMWKMMSGFKPGSFGYEMADRIERATSMNMSVISRANAFYDNLKSEKGYDDFFSGETKMSELLTSDALKKKYGELSALEAAYAVAVIGDMSSAKGYSRTDLNSPYYNPAWVKGFVTEDGKVIKAEDIVKDMKGLSKALKSSDIISKYLDATTSLQETLGKQGSKLMYRHYGYVPAFFANGKFLPANWAEVDEKGNPKSTEDLDSWDMEKHIKNDPTYTLQRSADIGGYLKLVPMTKAVDAYAVKMADFIAYKDLRADLLAMNEKTNDGLNLADIAGNSWGSEFGKWMNNFVDDVTTTKNTDSLLGQLRLNLQKGALIGNPSTIMKQSSSYWSAAGILSLKSLVAARNTRYTGRNLGSKNDLIRHRRITNSLDPTVAEIIDKDNSLVDRIMNKIPGYELMKKGISWMDGITVNNLFTATVYDCISDAAPGTDFTSKDFIDTVEDKFNQVVIYTQPMFDKILRAEYGRTSNEAVRMLSMFRTQQTQNLNRLMTTIGEYRAAKEAGEDTSKQLGALKQTVAGQATAAFSLGLLSVIGDLLKHKFRKFRDEEEKEEPISVEKIFERIGLNALEGGAGTIWFGDEAAKFLVDTISGGEYSDSYGISMGVISTLNNAMDSMKTFAKEPTVSSARYAAGYIAQLFGIPLNNAYSYLNSAMLWGVDVLGGDNSQHYDDIIKLAEKNSKLDKNLKPAQATLRNMGMSKKESADLLKNLDSNFNGKLSQEEIEAMYYEDPEMAGVLQALWDMQGFKKGFETMQKSADKRREYNSNPLYAEVDVDESESVSKQELTDYALEHPDQYAELKEAYDQLGFKGSLKSAIKSAEQTQRKEEAEALFEEGDYNALFDSISHIKSGKNFLTNLIREETDDYDTPTNNLLFNFLTEANLDDKTMDTAVESIGADKYVSQYRTLRSSGLSPKDAIARIDDFDVNDNGSITQAELAEYYKAHKNEENIIAEFWAACGWSTSWAKYKKSKKIA